MKAEGRDGKSGNMNTQTKGAASTDTKVSDDGQRRHFGDRCTAGREAHPDRLRHQVGEDPGNHQRELQHFGRRRGACSVRFHPLPPRIVEIYPEWRGYEVILVHGRYVIVRPQTHEIVYIIEG